MNEPSGGRQADLDWLYGRDAPARPAEVERPSPADRPAAADRSAPADAPGAERPRIVTPAYRTDDDPPAPREGQVRQASARPASRHPQQPPRAGRQPAPRPAGSRPTGDSGRPPGRRRTRRRQLRLVGVLLAAWLVFLIGTPVFALARMDRVDQSQSDARPPRQPGTATLLVGSDARDPGPGYEPVPGDEDLTTARADTIMLLYQPRSGRPVLVSLPRDSYVPIPDLGQDKLNAAYAYGGPALLTETVEQVTGVRIDGYLEIGFDGFSRVVDAVGGVEVCTDIALQDDLSGLDIPAGCTQLDGQQALAYVRMRYADPRGDIGRAERQREIIGKVVGKAASPVSVLNPVRYWSLNMAAADMVTKGDQTGPLDLLGSARALIGVAGRDGLSLVVPIADPSGVSDTGASVVIWDRENALALFDEISRGDTSQLDRFLG